MNKKVIVLDDDPTGCQTVHGINIYTTWTKEALDDAFQEPRDIFYILTNSRSMTASQTEVLHRELLNNIINIAEKYQCDFDVISRSDSTLRGHYPLEPDIIREELERYGKKAHAEFVIPFFKEGGRITEGNVHYIEQKGTRIRADESEYAKDPIFGYKSSNLKEWIEEKTRGSYSAEKVKSITLDMVRSGNIDEIVNLILNSTNTQKFVVNATEYSDLKPFVDALKSPKLKTKTFLFRTAASFVKVYGEISDKPLLTGKDLRQTSNRNGGVVIVGSFVNRTTQQFNHLRNNRSIEEYKLDVFKEEAQINVLIEETINNINNNVKKGLHSVVYTSREVLLSPSNDTEENLKISRKISDHLVSIVKGFSNIPGFIIAKGGITSSDVATKGLKIKKGLVLGQVIPGVPVWLPDEESKFPKIPYVVYPGNVGDETSLTKVFDILLEN